MRKDSPLKRLREARTLDQTDMARLLRVSQPTYSKYETGRLIPPFHIKARIAAILGVSARDVFPEPSAQSKGAA